MILACLLIAVGAVTFLCFQSWLSTAFALQTVGLGIVVLVWLSTHDGAVATLIFLGCVIQWVLGVAIAARNSGGWKNG